MSGEDRHHPDGEGAVDDDGEDVRDRLEREADRAIEGFDDGIVDLLSWVLDTETRARIYVFLRQHPESTSDEVADGTGLYPSTVREALAELHGEGTVAREKRESSGAGNNPYEYSAMAPSDLVADVVEDVQSELNTVCNLDCYLGSRDAEAEAESEPVTITVEGADAAGSADATSDDSEGDADSSGGDA